MTKKHAPPKMTDAERRSFDKKKARMEKRLPVRLTHKERCVLSAELQETIISALTPVEAPVVERPAPAHGVEAINALEGRIVHADEDVDAMLWEQARLVVEQLQAGVSGRKLAAQWINIRTGKPYDERHVRVVRQTWEQGADLNPHPRFRELYNLITNRPHRTHRDTPGPHHHRSRRTPREAPATGNAATRIVHKIVHDAAHLLDQVPTTDRDLDQDIDGLSEEQIEKLGLVYARLDVTRIQEWVATLNHVVRDFTRLAARLKREVARRRETAVTTDEEGRVTSWIEQHTIPKYDETPKGE